MMTFDEQWELHRGDGEKYQRLLGELVYKVKPKIVVETGGGFSSLFILKAMDEANYCKKPAEQNHERMLYTIDPDTQVKFERPNFTWIRDTSQNALAALYLTTGPWDVFLHDSDHEVECQTFEYEMAYAMVRPGGWIISDDYEWGTPIHWAWKDFLARHGLECTKMGSASVTRKPHLVPALAQDAKSVAEYTTICKELAADALKNYRA